MRYGYEPGTDATKGIRPTTLGYPHADGATSTTYRTLHYLYADAGDTSGVSHYLSRISALGADTTRGTDDANVIAGYSYLGAGAAIRKDYPTPGLRHDLWADPGTGTGTSGTYAGLDRFGRLNHTLWQRYDATGDVTGEVAHVAYGYDDASNRLYGENSVYGSNSHVYSYDELHRLTDRQAGAIKNDSGTRTIPTLWRHEQRIWHLDAVGNATQVDLKDDTAANVSTFNAANEIVTRKRKARSQPSIVDEFEEAATASQWEKIGSGDAFNIDTSLAGEMKVTPISLDTHNLPGGGTVDDPEACAILLLGDAVSAANISVTAKLPLGSSPDQLGFVFGYQSPADYYISIVSDAFNDVQTYHVLDGVKSLISDQGRNLDLTMGLALSNHLGPVTGGILDASFGSGTPPGRVGLWTNAAGASFDHFAITPNKPLDLAGRWQDYAFRYQTSGGDANGITAGDQMRRTSQEQGTSRAAFVKGIHSDTFEIRFTLVDHTVGLAFAGLDGYNWNMVKLSRDKDSPVPFAMRDGVLSSSGLTGTYTASNYKFIAAGTPRPFKVTYDGTTLSVFTGANPGDVDNWAAAYTPTSFSPTGGGLLGFVTSAAPGEETWVDDLSIKLDTNGNGSYDSTETIERFTLDASGYAPQGPEYDAAGNIVYDGVHAFTFDAWNRLTKVHKAYKEATDNAGAVDLGSLVKGAQVQASEYDGQGRRIVRAITNSGNLDATYHYYYSGE